MVPMYVEIFLNKQLFCLSFIPNPPLLAVMMPLLFTAAMVQFGCENCFSIIKFTAV